MNILYISYDGILEPLGESQVLRYLEHLARDFKIILVSFEKSHDWQKIEIRETLCNRINSASIIWVPLRYHKRPSAIATAFDIIQGIVVGMWMVMRHRVDVVHARSYVPSVIALVLKMLFRLKYVFDMRGFWADERVDGGMWPAGCSLYQIAKWFERRFLLNADYVVSLTQAAVNEMRTFSYLQKRMPRFEVITTCADLELFRPMPNSHRSKKHSFTLGYVGAVTGWHMFDETLRCFQILREQVPDAQFHILNHGAHEYIRKRMAILSVDSATVCIEATNSSGVALAMQQMDCGIFFYKQVYSKKATAPTKLGEFLGCGIPCLGNTGVGDMAAILESERVGVAISNFDESTMRDAIQQMLELVRTPDISIRCRDAASRGFSLEHGVSQYAKIYAELGVNNE